MEERCVFFFVCIAIDHEQYCGNDHEHRRGIDSHAQVAESMDFGCLDDDEEERADGTTDNGER